jgi:hypothetical protein
MHSSTTNLFINITFMAKNSLISYTPKLKIKTKKTQQAQPGVK